MHVIAICYKYKMKETNHILAKYNQILLDINTSKDKNKTVIDLALRLLSNFFNPIHYKQRLNLIYPLLKLDCTLKEIAYQYRKEKYNYSYLPELSYFRSEFINF
jgi:hypothetical protein